MGKKIDFSSVGAIPVDEPKVIDFSSVGAIPVDELKPEKTYDMIDSANAGIQQGATLGAAPMIQGGIEGGMDAVQSIMAKLGLASPSPSDVNAQLAAEGVKGDLGPQSSMDMYRGARDQSKGELDAAMAANPGSALVGSIAGGVATLPTLPAKLIAPFGVAAEGAGIGSKMLLAARNAVPTAAIASANMSSGDLTKGEIDKVAADTVDGTLVGMGGAGLLQGAGTAISNTAKSAKNLGGKLVPDVLKNAFSHGKIGINTNGDEFYNTTNQKLNDVVNEVTSPIQAKSQAQTAAHEVRMAGLQTQEEALTKSVDETQALAKQSIDLEKQRQLVKNASDIEQLNKDTVETARKLQQQVIDTRKKLGQKYDQQDVAAEATGIYPDNRESLNSFVQEVTDNANLPESDLKTLVKKLQPLVDADPTPENFRETKKALNGYFENGNLTVKRAAKAAYARTKADYAKELEAGGYKQLADDIADTNKKWMATAEIENEFVDNLKPNRVTGQVEVAPATIDAVGTFKRNNPKEIAKSDFLSNIMNQMDPQGAPQSLAELNALGQRTNEAKNFTPMLPEVPQVDPQTTAEIRRLQDLLAQAKTVNPYKVGDINLPTDPSKMKDSLTNLLPKYGMKSGNDVAENQLDSIMRFFKNDQGEAAANQLQAKLKDVNQDLQIRDAVNKGTEDIPLSIAGLIKKAIGKGAAGANTLGRGVRALDENVSAAKEFMTKPMFLKKGTAGLADASNEEITMLAEEIANKGEIGQGYARVLNEAQGKKGTSRNAVMFGLMQQPEFRKLIHSITGNEDDSGPVK